MKKKTIEYSTPKKTRKSGWWTTVQMVDDIIVLNIYKNRYLSARHCINPETGEYATLKGKIWSTRKIETAYELEASSYYSWRWDEKVKDRSKMNKEDEEMIRELLRETSYYAKNTGIMELISEAEIQYGREKRVLTELNRVARVNAMMERMPMIPAGIKEWVNQKEIQGEDYCIKDREENKWSCSNCGEEFDDKELIGDGKRPKNEDIVTCPRCKATLKYLTRKRRIEIRSHFCMIQPIDDEISVARHFTSTIQCTPGEKKRIGIEEDVRIVMFKGTDRKRDCDIYYEQYRRPDWVPDGGFHTRGCFDNKHNPANKGEYIEYLYDGGIEEAFRGTHYEPWTRLFIQMSEAGEKLDYNAMMCAADSPNYIRLIEMLFRGRFHRLLQEESTKVSHWNLAYCGRMRLDGSSIEDVFAIGDKQKINRIREKNGGSRMMDWMQYSERHYQKISDKALNWLHANELSPSDMAWIHCRFSIEQAMNYIERQRKESYKGKSCKQVIAQYEDYMSMCERLKKDTKDEMVFRPRELKRRHDEAVAIIAEREAELQADAFSERFPGVEDILKSIKERYEYKNDIYSIIVPKRCVDIVVEGRALHHCAGSSDRYFDRIKQRETYICFLRKNSELDNPYYTIEVEPGGTIRQHRGYLDEEPEIEEVKPFLREWQKEIRKRMTEEDHKHAAVSAIKRIENIKELQEKNNTRVLDGLMEDFMEAM